MDLFMSSLHPDKGELPQNNCLIKSQLLAL